MSTSLSCCILTQDSERRLAEVMEAIRGIADEIVVLDSGSRDRTREIALSYGARFLERPFDNFRNQRVYAESQCSHPWILVVDSDEVLSPALANTIRSLKQNNFALSGGSRPDAFEVSREWFLFGKRVHVFHPITCPDRVVRLFRRDKVSHAGSRIIHESARGDEAHLETLDEPMFHYTADSIEQLYAKVNLYTTLSAREMRSEGLKGSLFKIALYPWAHWFRVLVIQGGWRDGWVGWIHARYVRDTIYLKYLKLRYDADDHPVRN